MNQFFPFLFAISRTDAIMNRTLSGHGLSFSDFVILHHLEKAPEHQLRPIDLAHKLGLTPSGITRMLFPLEKLHIIQRDKSASDARSRYARLTPAGLELLQNATATLENRLEDIIPANFVNKVDDLTGSLELLAENLLQPEYRQEAKQRWADTEAYRQSKEKMKKMSPADLERIKQEGEALTQEIAQSMPLGAASKAVQTLIARHYESLRQFYEPNPQMYRGLGQMYVDDPRFSAYYEKFAPGLATFLCDAINIFCDHLEKKRS